MAMQSEKAQEPQHISFSMSEVAKALESKKSKISVHGAAAPNQFTSW